MPVFLNYGSSRISEPVGDLVERGDVDGFVLVVPTRRRVRHLGRELLRRIPRQVTSSLPLHTLDSLASEIFQHNFPRTKIVSGAIQTLAFNSAVSNVKDQLKYFSLHGRQASLTRGTFERVAGVITHLKESGIHPDALDAELSLSGPDEQSKLRDIVAIYRAYDRALESMKGTDAAGVFLALASGMTQRQFSLAFRAQYPKASMLSLAGFDEFTNPEIEFVRQLCAVEDLAVSLVFDFQRGNSELFGHLEMNYDRFVTNGFVDVPAIDLQQWLRPEGSPPLQENVRAIQGHLAAGIFRSGAVTERMDCTEKVTLASARTRRQEVELICKIVKHLWVENPARDLSRICVAVNHPAPYTDNMRLLFAKYGIPANITDRFYLSRSPVIVSIFAMLQIPLRGYRREDILRALQTAYMCFPGDSKSVDSANLAAVSGRLKIVGGKNAWRRRIEQEILRVDDELRAVEDDGERYDIVRERSSLQQALSDFTSLERLLEQMTADAAPREFRERLTSLLRELEVDERLMHTRPEAPGELHERDARAYSKFLSVLEETLEVLEFEHGPEAKHPLSMYLDQLQVAVSQTRYNIAERTGEGVLVTAIEETRGLPLDVMIVAGLVDGEFPSVYQPEVFFSEKRMKEREQRHLWQSRYLFYQAITNWTEHLYLTYPEKEADLDLVRSTFVDELARAAVVREWKFPGTVPFGEDLFCEEELLKHYATLPERGGKPPNDILDRFADKLGEVRTAAAVELSRTETHGFPEFEGIIFNHLSPDARNRLASLKDRTFSASQLETYGKCPYRFFAQRLLRLEEPEDLDETLSPMERGSVLHEILFEFYTHRRDKSLPAIAGCDDTAFAEALAQLLEIAEAKLVKKQIPDVFWELEKELMLGREGSREGLMKSFLEAERARTTTLVPGYFEVGFGSRIGSRKQIDHALSCEEPVRVGSVNLRGKIDRIELGSNSFAVIDYKSGGDIARLEDIRQGIALQLPLYLYAMEAMLHAALGKTFAPAGGMYYVLKSHPSLHIGLGSIEHKGSAFEATSRSRQLLPSDADLRAVIDGVVHMVNGFVDRISKGEFPLTTPDKIDKVCTYCEYRRMCRIQAMRQVPGETSEGV